MQRAIELAKKGAGFVNPNPMVGCVIVKDDKIIGEDYHEFYGGFHAERNALLKMNDAKGATLYVTLEPCCHHGKTPPCTDIIIEKGIKKLDDREKNIMELRFGLKSGNEKTQKEVADLLGISQSYISRLEKRIMLRLRKEILRQTSCV